MSRLVRLYPRAWQARYGEELEALAAARPLGLGGAIDLVRGALDAHRHPELVDPAVVAATVREPVSRQRYEDLRVARRLGLGTFVGAALLLIAPIVALNGPVVFDGDGAYRDGMAAVPFMLAAMAMLSGGLLGQLIRIGPGHRVTRAGAILAIICGPLWAFGPWLVGLWALALAGLVAFAVGAWRAGALPGAAVLAIVTPGVVNVAILAFGIMSHVDRLQGANLFALAIAALAPIWLAIGATLLSLPDVQDDPAPAVETVREGSTA
ncbi:MAG: hypothetical protein EPO36_02440 [Chloroflexota bacterium]|nr:MAG: hypothetical protein EPO36_02440 [Chloroflexota bacterium]